MYIFSITNYYKANRTLNLSPVKDVPILTLCMIHVYVIIYRIGKNMFYP